MLRTVGHKLIHLVPVLFLVSLATFFMMELIPGDPAAVILGPDGTPEQYESLREELGLNEPVFERYTSWLGDTVRGDLGESLVPPVQDVREMIQARLPVTLQLALMATVMSLVIAIPVALYASYRAGHRFDRTANGVAFGAISVPSFLAALLLVFFMVFNPDVVKWVVVLGGVALAAWLVKRTVLLAKEYPPDQGRSRYLAIGLGGAALVGLVTALLWASWPEFPRQGFVRLTSDEGIGTNLRHAFLPALTLALTEAAVFMRLLRSDLISTLQDDFILSAKAKGMPVWRILLHDALRPSSFSLVTVAGVALGRLIGGTVIVETIFNLPGMGTMIVDAIGAKDFRVVQAGVLVIAVFYVALNAIIDISYAYLDPRIRRGRV
jgi:peptide/nickel transport system permease protein